MDHGHHGAGAEDAQRPLTAPRPGHADLAGALKFNLHDARYVIERALHLATNGRPGPVWIDVPIDVQAAVVDLAHMRAYDPDDDGAAAPPPVRETDVQAIVARIYATPRSIVQRATQALSYQPSK